MLPGWFLTLTAGACVAGLIGLGWVAFVAPDPDTSPVSAPVTSTPTPSPTPTPTPSSTPTPTPKPKPKPTVSRDGIQVSVLNATRTVGLAKKVSTRVTAAGWSVAGVGNWRYGAGQTAVHFPVGRQAEAQLLAQDLGVDAVLPAVSGMRSDRLTVLLLGLP